MTINEATQQPDRLPATHDGRQDERLADRLQGLGQPELRPREEEAPSHARARVSFATTGAAPSSGFMRAATGFWQSPLLGTVPAALPAADCHRSGLPSSYQPPNQTVEHPPFVAADLPKVSSMPPRRPRAERDWASPTLPPCEVGQVSPLARDVMERSIQRRMLYQGEFTVHGGGVWLATQMAARGADEADPS